MPDPQKSEVRPDAPEQDRAGMFCRDCGWYRRKTQRAGYCDFNAEAVPFDSTCRDFSRRTDAN